jgi:hypothetical protein
MAQGGFGVCAPPNVRGFVGWLVGCLVGVLWIRLVIFYITRPTQDTGAQRP